MGEGERVNSHPWSGVNCATTYNLLAFVSYKLGYISSALKTIEDVLQSDPQNVTALLSLSHIYSQERLIVADNLKFGKARHDVRH
jgi:Tfp pilus assembly protein PilF